MKNKTLNIKATLFDLTDEVRDYVESRIDYLDKFMDATDQDLAIFDIEVGKTTAAQQTGEIFRAEMNLTVHGNSYRTEATRDNLITAIDQATHELERQLVHHKTKRNTLFKRGAKQIKKLLRLSDE
jgi:putative sigma-54 modulation protein